MNLHLRTYQREEDYWEIRAFLREVSLLHDRRERCWQVARLDYWRWHVVENCQSFPAIEEGIFIWETSDGHIGAVLNPEGAGEAWLQIHPRFDSPELEEEMVILAEDRLAKTKSDETQALCVWTHETDTRRQALLQHRGYARGTWAEHQHRRFLDAPIPPSTPAPGYVVRALGDSRELPARSWISWRAFHPDEPDEAYEGWLWYLNIQRMPLYRRDLDIVAAAPTGELAAFCTLWYDDVTRTGYFEPVGTVPEHQRKGLGKAIMYEAMRRLQGMGGVVATVGGFSTAANALYGAVMPGEVEKLEPWIKAW